MGDALNALRPQRLRTKAASSLLPHWLDDYSECNSCSSRVLLAHVESANCPVAFQGLKITTSLSSVSMIFSDSQKDIYIISFTVTDKNGISDTVETLQSVDAVQTLPEISVAATDAKASEDGDTGKFTLTRTGDLSVALTVNFAISGSATSGVDYKSLGSSATFAAGQSTKVGTVTPISDTEVEGSETVTLTLIENTGYTVGASGGSANVIIREPKVEAQDYVVWYMEQARHATSRNSGTPVAVIRSPTQRIGDAPAALRPPQTEHKAAQSWLPQMALRLFGIKFWPPSRAIAHFGLANFPAPSGDYQPVRG
ncbi:Calx-beta domain-containing protein [Bathymodiolus japonicus methanotrophic gill symbiont]|uniref:Calx-beta domain-containing protein n=1 Tax=Bathymodiolus japonicus methanotrophic gill symbiont TaxID=113269 RepID=UPI001C8E1272|nr:Calx-beta domain-containing protein [Bathymodiolus japonicus methanotrophic gill symbiont]